MRYVFFSFLLLFLFACEKPDNNLKLDGCDEDVLILLGYVSPEDEVDFSGSNCIQYLSKLRFPDSKIYYMPNCNCCDLILRIFNCEGEDICDENGLCPGFMDAETLGIVGIRIP